MAGDIKILSRRNLVDRILVGSQHAPITFVVAPAGFGKSALLAQIDEAVRVSGGWTVSIAFQTLDHEPACFIKRIGSALGVDVCSTSDIASKILERGVLGALIFDDFDFASSSANVNQILMLARLLPDGIRIFIASRNIPQVSVVKLRLEGLIDIVDAIDLRFSASETLELFDGILDENSLSVICDRLQGWPALLQITRAWSKKIGGKINHNQPSSHYPLAEEFEYLSVEIYEKLEPSLKDFLRDVSVLSVIDPQIADSIRDRQDSGGLMLELTDLHPIISVDRSPLQARLHPLLREFLQSVLEDRYAKRALDLHKRAARALAASARVHEAVEHAMRGHDPDLAADIIEDAGGLRLMLSETACNIERIIGLLPRALIRSRPRIRILQIAQLLIQEYCVEAIEEFHILEDELREYVGSEQQLADGLRLDLEAMRTLIALVEAEQKQEASDSRAIESAISVARGTWFTDPRLLLIALGAGVYFSHRYGPFDRAAHRTEEMMRCSTSARFHNLLPDAEVHQALVALGNGRLAAAAEYSLHALQQKMEVSGEDPDNVSLNANSVLAKVCYLRNSLDMAMTHLDAIPHHQNSMCPHMVEGADAWRARIEFARGNITDALAILHSARLNAEESTRFPHLVNSLYAIQIEMLSALGDGVAAQTLADKVGLQRLWELAREPFILPWQEVETVTRAIFSLVLVRQWYGEALEIAETFHQLAVANGPPLSRALARVLCARAYRALGDPRRAIRAISGALLLTSGSSAYRIFLDQGPAVISIVKKISEGDTSECKGWAASIISNAEQSSVAHPLHTKLLTPREKDVLRLLAQSQSTKEIARNLGIAPETVRYHLKAIYAKCRVHGRHEAVAYARGIALLAEDDIESGLRISCDVPE